MVQLGELQEYYGEFQKAGVQVYAVSVDGTEPGASRKVPALLYFSLVTVTSS